ncbi:MAG: c-type cytochrome, partial [Bacteroidota bacterium]
MIKNHLYSAYKFVTLVFLFAFISLTSFSQEIPTDAAAISAGEQIFNGNCKACHRVHQKLVGPALADVYNRAPSIDWIKAFVQNSSKVIASGDDYAVKLYNEYNKTQMTAFSSLKDQDIMNVLAYIKNQTDNPPKVAEEQKVVNGQEPPPADNKYLNVILIGMVVILILLVIILGFLVSALKRFLDQRELSEE